jgi:transcriptional antiterminator NusG
MLQSDTAWYVIHAYSGHEDKVKANLVRRIETMGMAEHIHQVLVPTEDVVELKDGKRKHVQRRFFPGYILVEMEMNEGSWFAVRNTPGVIGFIGANNTPSALTQKDIDAILKRMHQDAPKLEFNFKVGENVRIVEGPFNDFHGKIDEINVDKGKLKVLVNMFGRETPVELDLLQIEKIH